MIGYPTIGLDLGDQHRAWRPVGLVIAGLALALLVGLTPASVARRRRRLQPGNAATIDPIAELDAVRVTV